MFSLTVSKDGSRDSKLDHLQRSAEAHLDLLAQRLEISPQEFDRRMQEREESYGKAGFVPKEDPSILFPGTYYLTTVDSKFRREYARQTAAATVNLKKLATPLNGVQNLQINGY